MPRSAFALVLLLAGSLALGGCDYLRLLRPRVLEQVDPSVARLLNELPDVDDPNEQIVGRLFAHGGLGHAERGDDGVYRASIRVPDGEFIWKPSIIVMEQGGELELEFTNEDTHSHHEVFLPSNGGRVFAHFGSFERARTRIRLDSPGMYWFGCPVGNHAGRGMLGLVLVSGNVPEAARLDRPQQPRAH